LSRSVVTTPMADALDDKAKRVLEAVWKAGGEADTSEIREYTGLTRGQIQYRVDGGILEEQGLVESRLVSASEEGTGSIRVTSLTERGDRIAGRVIDGDGSVTLDKQVEDLREEVRAIEDLAHRVDGHLDAVEERMDTVEDEAEAAIHDAIENNSAIRELDELVETAQMIERRYSEVLEENQQMRTRLHKMKEAERVLKGLGLVRNDAVGGWGNSDSGGFLKGPVLAKLDKLEEAGVLDDLGEQHGVDVSAVSRDDKSCAPDENPFDDPDDDGGAAPDRPDGGDGGGGAPVDEEEEEVDDAVPIGDGGRP